MPDDSHYKISSRPHYGELNPCEKGVRFATKKCASCPKLFECNEKLLKIQRARKENRDTLRANRGVL